MKTLKFLPVLFMLALTSCGKVAVVGARALFKHADELVSPTRYVVEPGLRSASEFTSPARHLADPLSSYPIDRGGFTSIHTTVDDLGKNSWIAPDPMGGISTGRMKLEDPEFLSNVIAHNQSMDELRQLVGPYQSGEVEMTLFEPTGKIYTTARWTLGGTTVTVYYSLRSDRS